MGLISGKLFKAVIIAVFVLYIGCLCYLAFFSYSYGRTSVHKGVNLTPFSTIELFLSSHLNSRIIITNIIGNIIAFLPMGLLLPVVCKKFEKFIPAFLLIFLSTLTIETTQLITSVGAFDVDDIILNMLGGVIGYAIIKLLLKVVKSGEKRFLKIMPEEKSPSM